MAHALIPLLQNSCSDGISSRFAVAPVARIILFAFTFVSVPLMTNGLEDRSTDSTSSKSSSLPHFSACARIRSIRSGPAISMNPGKFSISVVVISCPP